MGAVTRRVATKEELKSALKDRADTIVITDQGLARNVKLAKGAKKGVIAVVLAAGGAVAVNAWNPIGWVGGAGLGAATVTAGFTAAGAGAGISGTAVAITAIVALAYLGTLFMVMYNDYELESKGNGNVSSSNTATGSSDGPSVSNSNNAGGGFELKLTKRAKA